MTKLFEGDFKDFDKFKECRRLGIFDSGVGGLSIIKYLNDKQNVLSSDKNNKEIIYLADSGRFPYGTKSAQEILTYTKQIIQWFETQNVDLIVFGCNTASAIAGKFVYSMTNLPVLDLVEPVARYVSQLGLRVGILATQATVRSHAFLHAIKNHAPLLKVQEIASAELVNIVENGLVDDDRTKILLSNYIDLFREQKSQIVVLSCTHFSFLKDSLLQLIGNEMQILDPAELIANILTPDISSINSTAIQTLEHKELITKFFVTGNLESFSATAKKCLGYPIKNVNHLSISELQSLTTA